MDKRLVRFYLMWSWGLDQTSTTEFYHPLTM